MTADEYLRGEKVLVMGLGFVSAGATIKWLCDHGAQVMVTDLWPRGTPEKAIEALGDYRNKIELRIGEYIEEDFAKCEVLVVNPSISSKDERVQGVMKRGTPVENELSLFMRFCPSKVVAITGTRGKTTTAYWAHHFLKLLNSSAFLAGNMGDTPLLSILDSLTEDSPVVAEVSSFQLELASSAGKAPDVAVITNLMRDHLNRYGDMKDYADAKAHIFELQESTDTLILKKGNEWTDYFISKKPKSQIILSDVEPLGFSLPESFAREWGAHNVDNVKAAAFAAHSVRVPWAQIEGALSTLKAPPFRQEVIFEDKGLTVVNDTTATTPDGTIVALRRFKDRGEMVLIAGGTDKELQFDEWANIIQNHIEPSRLILLEGSATEKMLSALPQEFRVNVRSLGTLEACVKEALNKADGIQGNRVVLFSPGAASFEKFQNEFDRGRQFNAIVKGSTNDQSFG